jgi:hypothetical protein
MSSGLGGQSGTYNKSVATVFRQQGAAQKAAIIKGALANPNLPSSKIVLSIAKQNQAQRAHPGGVWGDITKTVTHAADSGLAKVESVIPTQGHIGGVPTNEAGFGPTDLGGVALHAGIDVTRAAIKSPAVIPKTIKGLGETAEGSVAALAQLPINIVQKGPVKAVSQLASGMAKDYSHRYGPLVNGNDTAFINRIIKQGAASEVLDAAGLYGGLDATVGRGLAKLGGVGKEMTGAENIFTRPRPALRISGNEVRSQMLAPNAGRILAQRVEDRVRGMRRSGEISLRPGEVAPVHAAVAMRKLTSGIQTRYRTVMQKQVGREVYGGSMKGAAKLSAPEKQAAVLALHGGIPLRSGEKAAVAGIDRWIHHIEGERARNPMSPGNHISPQVADKVDVLRRLQDMRATTDKWLTPKLADFVDKEGARSARLERDLPSSYLSPLAAEARRLRGQGDLLGHTHPDELHAQDMVQGERC